MTRHLLLVSILLLILSNTVAAQSSTAWTTCQGQTVQTFVNVGVLGTDSTEEILRHEEVHRAQAKALIDSLGTCPYLTPQQVMKIEAEAYCASDSVRVRVKKTPRYEANAISLQRLLTEFYPDAMTADTIVATWKRVCP